MTDQRVAESEDKLSVLVDAQVLSETKLAALAKAQAHTDRRLETLIDVVERYITKGNNGTPQA